MLILKLAYLILSLSFEANASESKARWGALPVFNYTSDQGTTLGGLAQRFDYGNDASLPFKSLLTLQSTYAERGPQIIYAAFEKIGEGSNHSRNRFEILAFQNEYQNYYGLGNETAHSLTINRIAYYRYGLKQISVDLSTRRPTLLNPALDYQIGVSPQDLVQTAPGNDTKFGEDFSKQKTNAYYTRFFSRLILDRRNSEFIPSQGYYALGSFLIAPGILSTQETWMKADFSYRRYDPILSERWLWLATELKYTVSSPKTPLFERARIGGRSTLRGLPLNRFIDSQAMVVRTELRSVNFRANLFELPLKLGQGVFIEGGKVSKSLPGLAAERTHFTWGFSLFGSYFTDDFLGGADLGFSEDGLHFYFNLGHAF